MQQSHFSENQSKNFSLQISQELKLNTHSVDKVIKLSEDGNTVPFIARYRKEATGGLDEVQIRAILDRLNYLHELEARRTTILESILSQGKLTDSLKKQLLSCDTKNKLEDLYLPYKPKRRTRAMIAKERGLEGLARLIIEQGEEQDPQTCAKQFVNKEKEVLDEQMALSGARDIVCEWISEQSEIRSFIREQFEKKGVLTSKCKDGISEPTKFEQYYDYDEPISSIPSHRFLAICRGEKEKVLTSDISIDEEQILQFIANKMRLNERSSFAYQLSLSIEDAYKRLLLPSIRIDTKVALKMKSDGAAIDIFAQNLEQILLAPPLGPKTVIGIDPGLRTGCKCAVIQNTGRFLENKTIFLHNKESQKQAKDVLLNLIKSYDIEAIAIGNGTGGREAESFVKKILAEEKSKDISIVSVSESGASVYSASELAREEFPNLDLTVRGAISIARRLQDPLAELVKVEPKSMGVGQYQHDVYQNLLVKKLANVVETCVNRVGVELNTASAPLLSYVSGIGDNLAKKIIDYREKNGPFKDRSQLKNIGGLGLKTFEQSAGFLRLRESQNPLDSSAVHPESYPLVEKIASDFQIPVNELLGNEKIIQQIDLNLYKDDQVGELTLKDILEELKKPGRDPRSKFETAKFLEGVSEIFHLKKGMKLEGIVTNVTAFGAFVDIGVHQDGLIHISELSDSFVKDPNSIVKTGSKIEVEVLEVDQTRKRISLSAKKNRSKQTHKKGQKTPKDNSKSSLGSLLDFNKFKPGF